MSLNLNVHTDKVVAKKYSELPQGDRIQAYYLWIDGTGQNLRGKTKTLDYEPKSAAECPIWNFDGSSTGQAEGENSDVYLHPVAIYRDPIRQGNNKIVLCETYDWQNKPTATNYRYSCKKVMDQVKEHEPWFGLEQEYTLFDLDKHPYGWPKSGFPEPIGFMSPYYCSVGANKVHARDLMEAHYRACLYSGLNIAGTNAEGMLSQWEFQIGPCSGIDVGDELWVARYLLHRIAEDFDIVVSLDPKPVTDDWNGSGCHANYSTKVMREPGGITEIYKAIELLSKRHHQHLEVYDPLNGRDNLRRLTGLHDTAGYNLFVAGVANRSASIRIPRHVDQQGCGYLEDRRPSSNCDPYRVAEMLVRTTILEATD